MKKVLVFGGSGLVGSNFLKLNSQFFNIRSPSASEVDILNKNQIAKVVEEFNPDSIVNFAAFTQVEEAEDQKDDKDGICFQVNAIGARNIAEVAKHFDKRLIHISTEYVFDGRKSDSPYTEEDTPNPINWYGMTKLIGEQFVTDSGCLVVLVRISMPFSSDYKLKKDIVRFFLEQLKANQKIQAVEDQTITPTLVDDISNALKVLIENKSLGIYHVSCKDSVSPLEFVNALTKIFNLDYSLINFINLDQFNKNKKGKLLKYSWLSPAKFEKEFGDKILQTVEEELIMFKTMIDQNH